MPRNVRTDPKAPAPRTLDDLRRSLVRKLVPFVGDWQRCPQRVCRRRRQCTALDLACRSPWPARRRTPEQEAAAVAHLQRAIKRRLAEPGR